MLNEMIDCFKRDEREQQQQQQQQQQQLISLIYASPCRANPAEGLKNIFALFQSSLQPRIVNSEWRNHNP